MRTSYRARGALGAPRKRRSRSEFVTTNTDENAIAPAAITGFSSPNAASGIAATLYAKAQNRLPLIVASVRRDRAIASAAAREVADDEREVARLDRDVGAGAHRDAEIGLRERGCVVHAVADDGDPAPAGLELAHDVDLARRQHAGDDAVDADLRRRRPGRPRSVAGRHHDFEPEVVERARPRPATSA